MWVYLFQGIGYGLIAASQPGPLQTYLISQTLTRGWKQTLPAALAPLISDGPIILICILILNQVPAWLQSALYIAGGLFILYLTYGTYKTWKGFDASMPVIEPGTQQSLLKASLMNILNPNPYIFWTLVTGPILLKGWHESPVYGIGFLAGFYITLIGGLATIIVVFGTITRMGPKINRLLLGISTVALFCFGLYELWLGVVNQ